ncbi:glucoside xylosyltransferase 1 isoform X4 [Tachysurus fulvidraco]|uniref:glucoside xylosyltransferase 1 isoform X4 n=1 Tax=Tachysurus fulvidraco TaxID=1234273 RepID=UPI001FEFDC74|nr:glucoside xylosyltransferase 1 isoform X4 [Tachysurus fulvidraco]XP_047675305.1 glucoside xylosyltransferase 1 isoform X4 [Tachysurus fulvidraco]
MFVERTALWSRLVDKSCSPAHQLVGVVSFRRYSVDETLSAVLEVGGTEMLRLAVVACGPRLEETLTMLKSAVLFSRRTLQFYIFAEDELHSGFRDALESWPVKFRSKFNYTTYRITFPGDNAKEWKRLFKPCASQRLFLPLILTEVDSLLYVDTDILFLQPVEEIWNFLSRFNSSHLAAMAPEHEEPRIGWYNRFARHPYYGKTGVNSGVMLMNMTRIRAKRFKNDMTTVHLRWSELLMPLLQKYKLNITWGDQDLLNIIFHYNPESLLVFPCHWNYRPDHCIYGSNCAAAERHGVYVLHGNRGVYHDDKQPAFRAVYEAVRKEAILKFLQANARTSLASSLVLRNGSTVRAEEKKPRDRESFLRIFFGSNTCACNPVGFCSVCRINSRSALSFLPVLLLDPFERTTQGFSNSYYCHK